jgi:hypothetical protein
LWIQRLHGLDKLHSKILFAFAVSFVVLASIILSFAVINLAGYWIISLAVLVFFTIIYSSKEGSLEKVVINHKSAIALGLIIIGLILLTISLSLTSQTEDKLTLVNHHASIISSDFIIQNAAPDNEVAANLTSQDALYVNIFVAPIIGSPPENTTVNLEISKQPQSSQADKVLVNKYVITHELQMNLTIPKNETYYFKLNYNYSGDAMISQKIIRYWSSYEMAPEKVYTPFLAIYSIPALIVSFGLLLTSAIISVFPKLNVNV